MVRTGRLSGKEGSKYGDVRPQTTEMVEIKEDVLEQRQWWLKEEPEAESY